MNSGVSVKSCTQSMLVLLLLIALAPCQVRATENSKQAVSKPAKFTFAWPLPSKVAVTETTLKKGKTAKTRYNIILEKSKTDGDLELRFEDFEILNLDGLDLTVAENREKLGGTLKQVSAMVSMIPSLKIDRQGNAIDVVGLEPLVDKVVNMLPADNEKLREAMRTKMSQPETIQQVKEKTKDFWRVWVETWSECKVAPGKEQTVQTEVPVMGVSVAIPLTITNEGSAPNDPASIKLSAQSVLEGSEAKNALINVMTKFVAELPVQPGAKPFSPSMIKEFKRTQRFSVVTNPATLQPHHAMSEIVTDLTVDEQKKTQIEKHEYQFDWSSDK